MLNFNLLEHEKDISYTDVFACIRRNYFL